MMAADSLHVAVHLIVPSGVSFCCPSPCCRACSASASTPHFALPSAQPSNVQASCLERARPAAVSAFAGALAARAAAPPGRRCPERQRGAKAEGTTKGRGTGPLAAVHRDISDVVLDDVAPAPDHVAGAAPRTIRPVAIPFRLLGKHVMRDENVAHLAVDRWRCTAEHDVSELPPK